MAVRESETLKATLLSSGFIKEQDGKDWGWVSIARVLAPTAPTGPLGEPRRKS